MVLYKKDVKIGWTERKSGFYGSAVHTETAEPLGSLSICYSERGYEITTHAFANDDMRVKWHHKNNNYIFEVKNLARLIMLTSLGVDFLDSAVVN